MTAPKIIEVVLAAGLFAVPPVAGCFLRSPSGKTALSVVRVRRMLGDRSGVRYRLFATRVRFADLPPGIEPLPWPKKAAAPPVPDRDAFIGPPLPQPAKVPAATVKAAERRRVVALLRDDRDADRPVHKVRVDNQTALAAEWIDPEDMNTQRRMAKRINGFRSRDCVQILLDNGTVGATHARAARRFRRDFELGEIGLKSSRSLADAPGGFGGGAGPSESRLAHLESYQATAKALGPHLLQVIIAIAINEETLAVYAQRKQINRQAASGYLLASLELLRHIYNERDKAAGGGKDRSTIGPGLGPSPEIPQRA